MNSNTTQKFLNTSEKNHFTISKCAMLVKQMVQGYPEKMLLY